MLLKIKNLLSAEECARLAALAGELKFVVGRVSNPASTAKQNLQADTSDPKYLESVQVVANAMARAVVGQAGAGALRRAGDGARHGSTG